MHKEIRARYMYPKMCTDFQFANLIPIEAHFVEDIPYNGKLLRREKLTNQSGFAKV